MRVYALARELDVDSKDLLQYCKEMGFDVKNQLSSLDNDQVDRLKERAIQGLKGPSAPPPASAPKPVISNIDLSNKVRTLPPSSNRPLRRPESEPNGAPAAEAPPVPEPEPAPEVSIAAISESPSQHAPPPPPPPAPEIAA